jgi:hypothetical protein
MMANFSMSVSRHPRGLSVCEIKCSRDLRAISEAPGVLVGGAEKKLPLAQEPLPGSFCLVVSVVVKPV